ncbi:MAG: SMP-30/gluconolactonase/LRE family protein [Acidimicrobiia bacterium]
MDAYQADLLVDCRCLLGESPFWDPSLGAIAWVDIDRSQLHRLTPSTGSVAAVELPTETSFVAAAEAGGIVGASPLGVFARLDDESETRMIASPWFDPELARPNDGAVDPNGRIWVGFTRRDREPESGAMGVVVDGEWVRRIESLTLPNGIAWSPDGDRMYYVDTFGGTLWTASYDSEAAVLADNQPLFGLERGRGLIDGICTDLDGTIWAAIWGGHAVLRIDATGREIGRVDVGSEKVTSCSFGPPGSTVLYITSANPEGTDVPGEGGFFAVDVGVQGVPVAPAVVANRD